MDELYRHLENQVMALVKNHLALQEAHVKLKQSQLAVSSENEQLLVKQQQAITHIEAMVSRLKSIET